MMLHEPDADVRDQAVATPVRIVALDRARSVITLLVVLHHSVINYTHFGPDEWFAGATPHLGSWWPVWDEWITQLDSDRVPAREPGGGKLTIIRSAI
jgi:poly(3-hydroxyalkanoate) synthetase